MQSVELREFQEDPVRYLIGEEPIMVKSEGETIGHYYPHSAAKQARRRESMKRLHATVQRVLAETGLTEDELVRLFDLNTPMPDLPARKSEAVPNASDDAGR